MGNPSFDPTSPGSQQFLLRVLKHMDIKAVDIDSVAKEEGITKKSAMNRLNGIKRALEQRAKSEDCVKSNEAETPKGTMPRTLSAKKISTPHSKRRRSKVDDMIEDEGNSDCKIPH